MRLVDPVDDGAAVARAGATAGRRGGEEPSEREEADEDDGQQLGDVYGVFGHAKLVSAKAVVVGCGCPCWTFGLRNVGMGWFNADASADQAVAASNST